jgi:cytochrome P450
MTVNFGFWQLEPTFVGFFSMALALHHEVLARAQADVDSVVGGERCPTFEDEAQLPYIKALIKEVLRWRPTGPTAIPHASVTVSSPLSATPHRSSTKV